MKSEKVYRCFHCWATYSDVDPPIVPVLDVGALLQTDSFFVMYQCSICDALYSDKEIADQCCPKGESSF